MGLVCEKQCRSGMRLWARLPILLQCSGSRLPNFTTGLAIGRAPISAQHNRLGRA